MHQVNKNMTIFFLLFVFAISSCSFGFFSVKDENGVVLDSVPVIFRDSTVHISLTDFFLILKWKCIWDENKEILSVSNGKKCIIFRQDNPFVMVNDQKYHGSYAPFRNGATIFFEYSQILELLKKSLADEVVTIDPIAKNIFLLKKESAISPQKSQPIIEISQPTERKIESIGTIVIDPGHGGKDPGAIGKSGLMEKDIVLKIAIAMRDALKKHKGITVYMTRDTDIFIPLRQRTKFANQKNADLFISIHANSIGGNAKKKKSVKGYKIYFLSHAKNEADKRVAMIENSVIEMEDESDKGDYLSNILNDMANNEFLKESQDVSISIAEQFAAVLKKIKQLHTGVGQANFWVLNGAYMPSVLVEVGFISNLEEEKLLKNINFQKDIGSALQEAVIDFKKKYEAQL